MSEGLLDELVGAAHPGLGPDRGLLEDRGRQDDPRRGQVGVLLDHPAERDPVHFRQQHVRKDEVGLLAAGGRPGFFAVGRRQDPVPLPDEARAEQEEGRPVVVHHEDLERGSRHAAHIIVRDGLCQAEVPPDSPLGIREGKNIL